MRKSAHLGRPENAVNVLAPSREQFLSSRGSGGSLSGGKLSTTAPLSRIAHGWPSPHQSWHDLQTMSRSKET
eukprot:6198153-Pleurochrysis_carterae.AAC.1